MKSRGLEYEACLSPAFTCTDLSATASQASGDNKALSLEAMREISPAIGMSVDEYINLAPEIRPIIEEIRRQKRADERLRPSASLIDQSKILTAEAREKLVDKIAALVDENYAGRSEMCQQFAMLRHRALTYMNFPSRAVAGTAIYYDDKGDELFRWNHAWVRVDEEVIDGNVDVLRENPLMPDQVFVRPYWGPSPRCRRTADSGRNGALKCHRMSTWMILGGLSFGPGSTRSFYAPEIRMG
jgi:hypothetical protein